MRPLLKLAVILVAVLVCTGCSEMRVAYPDKPDFRGIPIIAGMAFDIRLLKDSYGQPQFIVPERNALVYMNAYLWYNSYVIFFCDREPDKSEIWYLTLRPTADDHYYTPSVSSHEFTSRKTAMSRSSPTPIPRK